VSEASVGKNAPKVQTRRRHAFAGFSAQECCVIGATQLLVHGFKAITLIRQDSDFLTFYASAFRARLGESMYFVGRNHNPPHFHALVSPLTYLPPAAAWLAWTVLSALVALAVVRWVMRASSMDWTPRARWILAACLLNAAATQATLRLGQVSWIVGALVTGAWIAARNQRWRSAGMWAGTAIAVKPFLLVLLALMIVRRQWRAAAWAIGACIVMLTAGGLAFGWNNFEDWIRVLRTPPATEYFQHLLNASLMGFASRAGFPIPAAAAASAIVLLATAWRLRLIDEDRAWLLVLVAGLLASPLGHMYYAPIFLGPIVVLIHEQRLRLRPWCIALFMFPPIGQTPFAMAPWLNLSFGSVYMWALLGLWLSVLLARESVPSATSSQAHSGFGAPVNNAA